MKTYNGGSISNLIFNLSKPARTTDGIYVTDTAERATRYANAQVGGVVCHDLNQKQAEGTAILEIDSNPQWQRRPDNHPSLDHCEAVVKEYQIKRATLRFSDYENTTYGNRRVKMSRKEVVDFLTRHGITVEIVR